MKLKEIETKIGTEVDIETVNVVIRGKSYTATLNGATLNKDFKPVLTFDANVPKTSRTPKADAKPAKK